MNQPLIAITGAMFLALLVLFSTESGADDSWTREKILELTSRCAKCHDKAYGQWKGSPHAASAGNSLVLSVYNGSGIPGIVLNPSYKADFPNSPGDCSACHAPDLAIGNHSGTPLDKAANSTGVSCLFCHFVERIDFPYGGQPPGVHRMALKGWDNVRDDRSSGCIIPRSPLLRTGMNCSPCHSAAYYDTPVYVSFDEWRRFNRGRQCYECHMPDGNHSHSMSPHFLGDAIAIEKDTRVANGHISVALTIQNKGSAHFLPTGHPLRNLLLVVFASDSQGKPLPFREGDRVPPYGGTGGGRGRHAGDYAGYPGAGFARVLKTVPPASCYGVSSPSSTPPVGRDLGTELLSSNLFFPAYWKRSRVAGDTRIPPGGRYQGVYRFSTEAGTEKVDLEARLIYRKAFKSLADHYGCDLKDMVVKKASWSVTIREKGSGS